MLFARTIAESSGMLIPIVVIITSCALLSVSFLFLAWYIESKKRITAESKVEYSNYELDRLQVTALTGKLACFQLNEIKEQLNVPLDDSNTLEVIKDLQHKLGQITNEVYRLRDLVRTHKKEIESVITIELDSKFKEINGKLWTEVDPILTCLGED